MWRESPLIFLKFRSCSAVEWQSKSDRLKPNRQAVSTYIRGFQRLQSLGQVLIHLQQDLTGEADSDGLRHKRLEREADGV